MRWRFRIWFLKRDENGKALEPAPPARWNTDPPNAIGYYNHPFEDGARKEGVKRAGPGSMLEIRTAPTCFICNKEMIGSTEAGLQKQGWGGNGDAMVCKGCGDGSKGSAEPKRETTIAIIQLCDQCGQATPCACKKSPAEIKKMRAQERAEYINRRRVGRDPERLVEQLKKQVEVLNQRLKRLKNKPPPAYEWPARRNDEVIGLGEYTYDSAQGLHMNGDDDE